jgi:hypothetical protein
MVCPLKISFPPLKKSHFEPYPLEPGVKKNVLIIKNYILPYFSFLSFLMRKTSIGEILQVHLIS